MCIFYNSIKVDKKEINVTGDIVSMMINNEFEFVGNVALIQNNKPLYPFGYPYAYKINHHNQNILHFSKI